MFCVCDPTAHSAAPSSSETSAPMRAHEAIPFAICCNAALPGRAVVDGVRLTLANSMVSSLSKGAPNGRWRDPGAVVCENGLVLVAVAHNVISKWPPAALYGAGAGVLVIGLLV